MSRPLEKHGSIDYDGCLSHQSFQKALMNDDTADIAQTAIQHNSKMMGYLQGFKSIMVGSNRQDVVGDFQESMKKNFTTNKMDYTGSCFSVLTAMSKKLGCAFDTFLLGDIYSNRAHGYTYNEAMKLQQDHPHKYAETLTSNDVKSISLWAFDHKKVSLIYAQIQKLALENPDKEIEYHFFDDREDILDAVETFYQQNRELIPGNVTLKTVRYYNSNPDRKSDNSMMELEERKTIKSFDAHVKANPLYDETLKTWAAASKDETGELEHDHKKIYAKLPAMHKNPPLPTQLHENIRQIISLTKTSSAPAIYLERTTLDAHTLDSYKQKLVDIFKTSWDKQYFAGSMSIGYSAVLRGMTKELEKHPGLLAEIKNELKNSFEKDAQSGRLTSYSTYRAGNSFRVEEFERDWKKFTGANANIFQKAAKTIMQAFKQAPEEEQELNIMKKSP